MTEHVASRTLVKSPPELWAECSDATSLARHLDQFGDIKITRLDPETAVAWEGERTRGTVRIEPAGWGTKVILTAVAVEEKKPEEAPAVVEVVEATVEVPDVPDVPEAAGEVPDVPEAGEPTEAAGEVSDVTGAGEPSESEAATPAPRRRRFPRLFRFRRDPPAAQPSVDPEQPAEPERPAPADPEPAAQADPEPAAPACPRPERTPEPDPTPERDPAPEPVLEETAPDTAAPETTEAALTAALDSLGQAHHRPYSRA